MQKGPLRFVYLWTMWCERPADAHQAALWRLGERSRPPACPGGKTAGSCLP